MTFKMQRPKGLEDWQSSIPSETVERAKRLFAERKEQFRGTANFGAVGSSDKRADFLFNRGCHASMGSFPKSYRDVLVTENGRERQSNLTKEEARPFLQWFINDSPYAFIILNRDDPEYCENFGFVLAGDVSTRLVQSACIISRHFYEGSEGAFKEFNKLVERGIDGFIAYQICFNSNLFGYVARPSQTTFIGAGGHRVSEAVTPEVALNYYQGIVPNGLGATYQEAPTIHGSTALFIGNYFYNGPHCLHLYRENSLDFHNFLREKEGKNNEVYRPPNPFVVQPRDLTDKRFTCEQAVTVVADYYQNYIKENL